MQKYRIRFLKEQCLLLEAANIDDVDELARRIAASDPTLKLLDVIRLDLLDQLTTNEGQST